MKRQPLQRKTPMKRTSGKPKKKKRTQAWPDGTPANPFPKRNALYGLDWKGEATWIHAKYVRARDGRCVNCQERDPAVLQCAHIMRRGYLATRTAEDNAVTLCRKCHYYLDHNTAPMALFLEAYVGIAVVNDLHERAQQGTKTGRFPRSFWFAEWVRLRGKLDVIEGVTTPIPGAETS